MQISLDPGALRVLASFGLDSDQLLGSGGEAWVFALDRDRVLRINKPRANTSELELRTRLLCELAATSDRVPFSIPEVLDTQVVDGRVATIERRLPGRVLSDEIADSSGEKRAELIRAYLDATHCIGDLELKTQQFGELTRERGIRTGSFRDYLERSAARSLAVRGNHFRELDAASLVSRWPEPDAPAFVHLDAFPGNMLAEGGVITSVLDFGGVSIVGDRRMDPLAATAYLAPEITHCANNSDRAVAREWLAAHDLDPLFEPAQHWLAAFWSGAPGDSQLNAWCRSILSALPSLA